MPARYATVPTLIAVASCHARPAHRQAQRLTWAPHLTADVRFFVGRSEGAVLNDDCSFPDPSPIVTLDVDDSYDGLSQKTWAIARWALARGYELVLKANDDVMLFPGRLRLPPASVAYAGWEWDHGTWIQGHVYWMRRRALEILAAQPRPPVSPRQVEDRWVGATLTGAGVRTWNDPGIGCVRRPQRGERFDLAAMLAATGPFYAAAEFAPEEIVALYEAVHRGTCWDGAPAMRTAVPALSAADAARLAALPEAPGTVRVVRVPGPVPGYETVEIPGCGAYVFSDGAARVDAPVARLLIDSGVAVAAERFAVPVGVGSDR